MIGLGGRGVMGLGLGRSSAGGAAVALHIEDSFTGANGTSLSSRIPDVANTSGNAWETVLGSWTIQSNCAYGTLYVLSLMVIESGAAAGVITMPSARGGNANGIVVRYVDNDNYWYIVTSNGWGFVIYERTAGTDTLRAVAYISMNTVLQLVVTLTADSITAEYDGTTISYSSTQHNAATKHGIFRWDFLANAVADSWQMIGA